jgi:FMN phosphatase YigB (HAD superfamily)
MPLSLDQYAAALDARNLPWPAPPRVKRARARPHLRPLPEVRAVIWSIYGTLLVIKGGELYLEHPERLMMDLALDKTVQEFKMWAAMTRKPGLPADYLRQMYGRVLAALQMAPSPGERHPEVAAERIWEEIIKKLLQKEYQWDVMALGSLNDFSRKVAYFFHASLQGTACYKGALGALRHVASAGLVQGWLDNGQTFTPVQLQRGLAAQDAGVQLDDLFAPDLRVLSHEHRARKPSENLFRLMLERLEARGIDPGQTLHVGAHMDRDVVPARRLGMRTALFAGDKHSLHTTVEQLKDRATRPDILLTELAQIAEVIPGKDQTGGP